MVFDREQIQPKVERVREAIQDDLNTPKAFSELFNLADLLRAELLKGPDDHRSNLIGIYRDALAEAGGLMGFLHADPDAWFQGLADPAQKARIDALVAQRDAARAAKDWAAADAIRAKLTALHV